MGRENMVKLGIIIALILAGGVFLHWSNKAIVTTSYEYRDKGVPEGFDGYRITQVSDLQSEYFGREQKTLLKKVRESRPDIIVFTGDLLDRNHTDYEASMTAMKGLVEIAPVYYVNGNHEMALPQADTSEFYDELAKMGVNLLFDDETALRRGESVMRLLGLSEDTLYESKVSDRRTSTEYDSSVIIDMMNNLTKNVEKEDFAVMLTHEPQFFETYEEGGGGKVNLIFAGHAHGGQIRLPFTEGLFAPGQGTMPRLTSGVHRINNTSMVISRGLGNSVFPVRLFNRPEVVVVELRKEK